MERYISHLLEGAERRTDDFLRAQVRDPSDWMYGGIASEIHEEKPTIYALTAAIASYVSENSRYYHSDTLAAAIETAVDFVRRTQRDDGSFDYPSCNFKSAPDTSFCFKRLIAGYRLLVKFDDGSDFMKRMQDKYKVIMHYALYAIAEGGFHTPNHRWGICAALMQGANLFADEADFAQMLRKRAGQYLAEGIDGDEDGEYAERSTGNYNAVVNNAMIALYEETGDDSYLGYVRRNLKMMLYYFDPDDTIFTQNSTRQDQGKQMYPDKYFYQYLFMAAHDDDPVFDAAAHKIIKDNLERGDIAPDCWHIILNHDEMLHHHFEHYGFLAEYRKFFRHAGVYRVLTPKFGYTVLNGKSAFLYFKTKDFCVNLKIGESYCDIRNFVPQSIEVNGKDTILKATAHGWFYLPFDKAPDTSDWWKMDQSKRRKLVSSQIDTTLIIHETEDGLDFTLKTEGLDRLPMRVELNIPAGTVIDHHDFWLKAGKGEGMILRNGNVVLQQDLNKMEFGPGFGEHEFQGHYSGEEINVGGYTIYMNAYTPFERKFSIRVK